MQVIHRFIAAGALLALSTGVALADNERGWEIGGGIGSFDVSVDGVDGTLENFDANDTSWKLFLGYRFNKYFSVEAAYVNFGEPSDDFTADGSSGNYSVGLSGFAPYLVGTMPLGPVELFAKVGYYYYNVDVTANLDDLGGDVFQSSDSGSDFVYGAGIGMTFMQKLNVRAEYERVDLEGADQTNALWLSAAWRF